ncbi:MAG: oxidoreductase [Azonexus sp.]|jgi:acetaldehyde dehydrogenase (acetylating)|nr:oxidoreductase [Azonexus sp.]
MSQSFRIVVIGAGETGSPLLRQLLAAAFVEVLGVADLDLNQPGIAIAKQHDVPTTRDFKELLVKHGEAVDIVIDVTGAAKVREALRNHMVETRNTHTLILHERIVLLMMSLTAGRLVTGKHSEAEKY